MAKRKLKINPKPDDFAEAVRPLGRVEWSDLSVHWTVRVTRHDGSTSWLVRERGIITPDSLRGSLTPDEARATLFTSVEEARDTAQRVIVLCPGDRVEIVRDVTLSFEEVVEPLSPLELLALQARNDQGA